MSESTATPAGNDLVIDLNFAPAWTRQPPPKFTNAGGEEARTAERHHDDDARRAPRERGNISRPDRAREGSRFGRTPERPMPESGRPPFRGERSPPSFASRAPSAPALAPLPAGIEVDFLPERRGMVPLATRLAALRRSYALFDVAHQFLSKPDYYQLRLTSVPPSAGVAAPPLFQCGQCRAVFSRKESIAAHVFDKHFDTFCKREIVEVEAPKGAFVCVARCRLSGELIGPPNYHGFNERMMELHKRRFSHMTFEAYRAQIENVRDAALLEKWGQEVRQQTVYHFGEGEKAVSFTSSSEAEGYFRARHLPAMIHESHRCILPGAVALAIDDPPLRRLIHEHLQQEQRFPLRLAITLRLAFRHLGLHTFKAANGATFLTSVLPDPLNPEQAIPAVRAILEHLASHPGCTRPELQAALCAEGLPEALPPAELAAQLHWLADKGHVIEFGDGRMAVPSANLVRHLQTAHPIVEHSRKDRTGQSRRRPSGNRRPAVEGRGPKPENRKSSAPAADSAEVPFVPTPPSAPEVAPAVEITPVLEVPAS